jgi:hypothetical protein
MTIFMPPINLDDHATPWAKAMQQRMDDVELAASRSTNEGGNANSTQAATLNSIAKQIAALPVPTGWFQQRNGFGLGAQYFVDQTIPIPAGKTKVVLTAIGNVAALDMTSGGIAVAQANIQASGLGFVWSTPNVTASKDAGASVVNNVITPAVGFQQTGLTPGGNILVSMALTASNPSAFPANASNFATLTVSAIFFS